MALRLRRGTNTERQLITPLEGELIYTTDNKELWVGDGSTQGGLRVTGTIPSSINDLDDVFIEVTPSVGQVLKWDGVNFVPSNNIDTVGYHTGDVKGSVFGDDSTVLVDGVNNVLLGPLIGDVTGSVFGDDSTVLVDGVNGTIVAPVNNLDVTTDLLSINHIGDRGTSAHINITFNSDVDISTSPTTVGKIGFRRADPVNGIIETGLVQSNFEALQIWQSTTGTYSIEGNWITFKNTNFGIGRWNPTATLDVNGDAKINGYTQFGSLTTTERNALTAANGMVIYNTTNNKFEGYQNGAWINLDDGTIAS